ncbi:MAG: GGDEF domain-containing protein [Clostridium butyricum]|nr:GGDEF domain-containing protein [Clostridium butyricum]
MVKIYHYIDLDNVKCYNDSFGHAVGAYILVCFANSLNSICN